MLHCFGQTNWSNVSLAWKSLLKPRRSTLHRYIFFDKQDNWSLDKKAHSLFYIATDHKDELDEVELDIKFPTTFSNAKILNLLK